MSDGEFQHLNDEVQTIWNANADFWNARMGEGNDFHRLLIAPAQERLLDLRGGELVLDIGCGNGQFARQMARGGARVLAFDASPRMIEHARGATPSTEPIEYRVLDATDPRALLALGERRFDAAVCTMAMMDMASIDPLVSSLGRLLKSGARFVFSVLHPCFNSSTVALVAEEAATETGQLVTRYFVRMSEYLRPKPARGVAMRGQPAAHYYFNRPISTLFSICFRSRFVLDGIEEPAFPEASGDGRPNWSNITAIPPALVARMRLAV